MTLQLFFHLLLVIPSSFLSPVPSLSYSPTSSYFFFLSLSGCVHVCFPGCSSDWVVQSVNHIGFGGSRSKRWARVCLACLKRLIIHVSGYELSGQVHE